MDLFIGILKLFAGVGLFLFAMHLLEESLKNLSGRSFKIFLQRATKYSLGAVVGGALITALLQSSSMVSLMVLALVGAGVFNMKNAMAIILGANLGTTLDSWLVATLGFKVNIEVAAYPAVCIGGLLIVLFGNRKSIKYLSYFLLGFGLLFIGLSFMKAAMESQVKSFDLTKYEQMHLAVYLLIGFIITLLVNSSSVTMALSLSAIHAGVIGLTPAAAIVLGSETGTTIKILISALGGTASKKRIALGNLLFNVFLTVFAFVFLEKILALITNIFGISDPLIGLVSFSTLINLLSIVVFLPFLNPFSKFLERFFRDTGDSVAAFIGNANVAEPETALDLFRKETEFFLHNSMLYNLGQFEIDIGSLREHASFTSINEKRRFFAKTAEEKYEFLKQLQGELQSFYLALRTKLDDKQNVRLGQMISSVRSSMHAVKSMKDIATNIANLRRSSKDVKFGFFLHHKKETDALYREFVVMLQQEEQATFKKFNQVVDRIQKNYSSALHDFYKEAQESSLEDLDITTAINFNRELFTSNKAMLMALKDYVLDEKHATEFNEILAYQT